MQPGVRPSSRSHTLLAMGLAFLAGACASDPPAPDPMHRPAESLLEVMAVLRRHVPDDTYRFAPGRDFTGRNVYRASLLRLENLERAHAETLRAGTWDEAIAFAKGRALERLRAYGLAGASYRNAARYDGELRRTSLEGAALCDALAEAISLDRSVGEDAYPGPVQREQALASYQTRGALLEQLLIEAGETHYRAIVREELERLAIERTAFLVSLRRLVPDGDVRALAALQRNVIDHRESKNANAHLLALADLYATLSEEYIAANPPESLSFDPARFEELVASAARLFESVSNQDGAPEKLEAARRLEAFLAFTLKVDRDRFSP